MRRSGVRFPPRAPVRDQRGSGTGDRAPCVRAPTLRIERWDGGHEFGGMTLIDRRIGRCPEANRGVGTRSDEATMTATKASVLALVEDEPDVRMLVRLTLTRDPRLEILGEAASATDAVELARTLQPGVVILDHGLEGDITG